MLIKPENNKNNVVDGDNDPEWHGNAARPTPDNGSDAEEEKKGGPVVVHDLEGSS